MESKDVLMVSTTYPRWEGDSRPRFVHDLACSLNSIGKDVFVLAPHHGGARFHENMDGIEIFRFPYFFPFRFQMLCCGGGIPQNIKYSLFRSIQLPPLIFCEFIWMVFLVALKRPRILHAHWILPQGFFAYIISKIFKTDYFVSVHGSDLFPLKSGILRMIAAKTLVNASAVFANSKNTEKEMRILTGDGINSLVIPLGVDTGLFKPSELEREAHTALFVGRLVQVKGVRYLIDAFEIVLESFPDAKLKIIGEGELMGELRDRVNQLGMDNSVFFLGGMDWGGVIEHYHGCEIFVFPSITADDGSVEGLGVALIEALSCEMAAVASDSGGIPDIIKCGETGLLVGEKDIEGLACAIISLFNDRRLAKRLGKNGRKWIKMNYSRTKIAQKIKKAYDEYSRA